MSSLIDVLLLTALPASGKSEVRRYLASLTPEQCRDEMHVGPTVQLDDYPYVHLMRRISQELRKRGQDGLFFDSDELPMKEPRDWGTLIELLNEDFDDLVKRHRPAPESAAEWLLDRFDAARRKVAARPALGQLEPAVRRELVQALEAECAELLRDKNAGIPDSLEGRTVVIEFARGGPDGSALPLPAPLGYRYSFATLSEEILARASILYVWVTPEESRRKNNERTDPNDPGSILHHGVPMAVMLGDYGCDDMDVAAPAVRPPRHGAGRGPRPHLAPAGGALRQPRGQDHLRARRPRAVEGGRRGGAARRAGRGAAPGW